MTRRAGKRVRVALQIYRDASGFEARAKVGEWVHYHRFPLNTPLAEMKTWQEDERSRMRHSGIKITTRGTLAADVDTYLARVTHLVGWVSLRANLRHWVRLFPERRRHAFTVDDLEHARRTWRAAGVAPKTINMRVDDLRRLWRNLDGPQARGPMDALTPLHVPKTPIRRLRPEEVLRVYQALLDKRAKGQLRDGKTLARFMVYATCGRRPSEIMRAKPDDLDLAHGIWYVRDGKGGFSPGVYLNADMLKAWGMFIATQAWGTFREGSFVETLRSSGWPAGVRPYNMRHNVGIEMSEAGVDLADVQAQLGHRRIETTRRHYVPVLNSRLQRASEAIDGRFGW